MTFPHLLDRHYSFYVALTANQSSLSLHRVIAVRCQLLGAQRRYQPWLCILLSRVSLQRACLGERCSGGLPSMVPLLGWWTLQRRWWRRWPEMSEGLVGRVVRDRWLDWRRWRRQPSWWRLASGKQNWLGSGVAPGVRCLSLSPALSMKGRAGGWFLLASAGERRNGTNCLAALMSHGLSRFTASLPSPSVFLRMWVSMGVLSLRSPSRCVAEFSKRRKNRMSNAAYIHGLDQRGRRGMRHDEGTAAKHAPRHTHQNTLLPAKIGTALFKAF